MSPSYNSILINGKVISRDTMAQHLDKHPEIRAFLEEWWNEMDFIEVKTSGSTGTPKPIQLSKQAIVASARKTISFFNIKASNTLLLCLPVHFIAGKLMLIRAMVSGANLILADTSLNPLELLEKQINFCAMTPTQAIHTLKKNASRFSLIQTLLLGGAPVPLEIEQQISRLTEVYVSYGMTETITHIALRKANEDYYHGLPGVLFKVSESGNLIIDADHLEGIVETTDQVELLDHSTFKWLGRADNVINSGGKKLFPEIIEKKLEGILTERYYVKGIPHESLGTAVALVVECSDKTPAEKAEILERVSTVLGKHEKPKAIITVKRFDETASGKVIRQ